MLATGVKPVYRFRVPEHRLVTINDKIRGEVTWNTDAVGDFVLVRSNGLPVYNFCVSVDDSLMGITHVLRAEEHLPNTLRQVLVYEALGYPQPEFAHMSLILAPDRSKLSKRHGATSVGDFREQGYLPQAMVNYLSLLGWNDGSEKEIYTTQARWGKKHNTEGQAPRACVAGRAAPPPGLLSHILLAFSPPRTHAHSPIDSPFFYRPTGAHRRVQHRAHHEERGGVRQGAVATRNSQSPPVLLSLPLLLPPRRAAPDPSLLISCPP